MFDRPITRRERTLFALLLVALSTAAFAAVWISTPRGVSTSPDAVHYFTSSRTLLAGDGYQRFDGSPLERWPPLYPTLLALLNLPGDALGVRLIDSLRVLNGLSLAAIVWVAGGWLSAHLHSRLLAVIGGLAALLAYPMILISFFAYSEPVFILLILLALWTLARYLETPARRLLIAAGVLAALAGLQRYAGVTLMAAGGLCLLILPPGVPLAQRFKRAAIFGVIAFAPLGLWFANNYRQSGDLSSGHVNDAAKPALRDVVTAIYRIALRWFAPEFARVPLWIAASAVILLAALVVVVAIRRNRQLTFGGLIQTIGLPVIPVLLFVAVYLTFLVTSSSTVIDLNLTDRFVSPAFVPLVLLLFVLLDRLAAWLDGLLKRGRLGLGIVAAAAVVWLVYPAGGFVDQVRDFAGADYHTWRNAPLIETLRNDEPDGMLYSNYPAEVLILTGVRARLVPEDPAAWPDLVPPGESVYLAWFVDDSRCAGVQRNRGFCANPAYDLADLSAVLHVEPVQVFDDGGLYRLEALTTSGTGETEG